MVSGILAGALALGLVLASGGSALLAVLAYVLGGSLASAATACTAILRGRIDPRR